MKSQFGTIVRYFNLIRLTRPSLIVFIICGAFCSISDEVFPIHAQTLDKKIGTNNGQSLAKQIKRIQNNLIKTSKDECGNVFGKYCETIANKLSLDQLYFVTYKAVENLLDQAASESIDSLTLFTHPLLQDPKGFAIVFNQRLLEQINNNFDFHGLFNISVPALDGGSEVKMKFFVIGQGKFIVGYDRNAKIKHPDYGFVTGKYDYRELFIMDAKTNSQGNPGLFNIKALSEPNGKLQWMRGPLNVDIQSLSIIEAADRKRKILIQYNLFGIKHKIIDPIPIEKLSSG